MDATNQLRARGLTRHDAIVEANHTRLRPILMTTVMLVAAMVPIALGNGPGAGARASMAKVIIGGQMLSLVLALLVTPVFYALLDMFVNFTPTHGHSLLGRAGTGTHDQATACRSHRQRSWNRRRGERSGSRGRRLTSIVPARFDYGGRAHWTFRRECLHYTLTGSPCAGRPARVASHHQDHDERRKRR